MNGRTKRKPAKARRTKYSEHIKVIYHRFIKPLAQYVNIQENESNFQKAIEAFFLANSRTIEFVRAEEEFLMPGTLRGSVKKIVRKVKKNSPLIIRYDDTRPNVNEVEYRDQMFLLNRSEFEIIKEKVRVIV